MRTAAVFSVALLALSTPARAQQLVPPFSVERLELDNSAKGSLTLASGLSMQRQQYRIFGALGYQRHPLLLSVDGVTTAPVISDRLTVHVGGAYAIFDGVEIGLQIPIVVYQAGADVSPYGLVSPDSFGFGAPLVSARWSFLRKTAGMPFDMAVDLAVPIPIGSTAALANDPGFGLTPRVSAGFDFSKLRVSAEVGVKVRPEASLGGRTLGSEFAWGVGTALNLDPLRLEVALKSNVSFYNQPTGAELLFGGRLTFGALEIFLLGGPGIGKSPGTPAFRLLLGAAAASPPKAKEAPRKAEPPPTRQLVERVDPCGADQPQDPAQCPDLDKDGDGVKNRVDRCPLDPEDKDFFQDEDGCPDPDNDGDGIADGADKCPNEAGTPERLGCPVRDADKDGIEDSADACPNEPGVPEFRGCPPQDQDKDGVLDNVDNCPTEPGPADNQGCPKKKKQLVVITKEKLVIKDKVYFDTGKATIQARSNALLSQIAAVLVGHPEIKKVRIEGHTDSTGSAETNRKLSAARAGAVRDFLMKKGVTPDRLTAQGFGPDRPAMPNVTRAGKEANRRVEFMIADEAAPKPQEVDDDLAPLVPNANDRKDDQLK